MKNELIYNFPWTQVPRAWYEHVIREFLDWGVDRFVFSHLLTKVFRKFEVLNLSLIRDEIRGLLMMLDNLFGKGKMQECIAFLHGLEKKLGAHFLSMHGLCGPGFDMNTLDPARRPGMIADHIRCMEIAHEFGAQTYTIHPGASHYVRHEAKLPELRKLAAETMTELVPAAERIGIVLAVENSFEPPNAACEVLALIEPYLGNPAVGVCYDTGHAHCKAYFPGKDPAKYHRSVSNAWYETGVICENALEVLKPHVVTCHMHDNTGYGDLHGLPGDGTIDWAALLPELRTCPRMLEWQTEIHYSDGENWAGKLLAPPGGYSIKRIVETFRKLGF